VFATLTDAIAGTVLSLARGVIGGHANARSVPGWIRIYALKLFWFMAAMARLSSRRSDSFLLVLDDGG
jgi:hypothetical protein